MRQGSKFSHKYAPFAWRVLSISLIAIVGVTVVHNTRAAVSTASFEAESSTLSGTAESVADSSGSGGAALVFSSTPRSLGWQLNAANTGLAGVGLNCSDLPAYTGASKPADGTVISGRLISTSLDLSGGTITIERSCIRPTTTGISMIITTNNNICSGSGCTPALGQVTIRDSEIDGSLVGQEAISKSCAFLGVGILERNYIHDTGSGICFFNTGNTFTASAVGNLVDRMRAYGDPRTTGSHNETFTIRDYTTSLHPDRQLVVRGNRFNINSGNDSGAIFIQAYGGFIDNVTIQDNLLEGASWLLVLESNNNGYGNNMKAINNRFYSTGYGNAYVSGGPGWTTWTDNYTNDSTKTDNKGIVVPRP